jgi:FixJ family two-component response regulator
MFLASQPPRLPSCLLLQIGPRDLPLSDVIRRVTAERLETPIIVIATSGDVPMSVRAMKAGAIEFLVQPLSDEDLLAAVAQAIGRSRDVLREGAELFELRGRYLALSCRERDVMTRVVAGRLNKQIGAALGISEITVKAHRGRVMRKMRAQSLAELVSMSIRLQLPHVRSLAMAESMPSRFGAGVMSLTLQGAGVDTAHDSFGRYPTAGRTESFAAR